MQEWNFVVRDHFNHFFTPPSLNSFIAVMLLAVMLYRAETGFVSLFFFSQHYYLPKLASAWQPYVTHPWFWKLWLHRGIRGHIVCALSSFRTCCSEHEVRTVNAAFHGFRHLKTFVWFCFGSSCFAQLKLLVPRVCVCLFDGRCNELFSATVLVVASCRNHLGTKFMCTKHYILFFMYVFRKWCCYEVLAIAPIGCFQ